ncbi:MAG: hypothetical protein Q8L29_03275, partial [archaeon]|nr:hypothetical protein [archaeon]
EPSIVEKCLDDLVNHEGRIAFKNSDSALKFAFAYAKCQNVHWGGAECVVRWEILARTLRIALERGIIKENDFYMEDEQVLRKISINGNIDIGMNLDLLAKRRLNLRENLDNPQYKLKKKFRYIDPHYLNNGRLHRLSESKRYEAFLDEQRKKNEKGINVDII